MSDQSILESAWHCVDDAILPGTTRDTVRDYYNLYRRVLTKNNKLKNLDAYQTSYICKYCDKSIRYSNKRSHEFSAKHVFFKEYFEKHSIDEDVLINANPRTTIQESSSS